MDGLPERRRLLFLTPNTPELTTQRRTRGKSLNTKIRRHLMVDIGMSRRKPSKTPQFDTLVWSLAESSTELSKRSRDTHSTNRNVDHFQNPRKDLVVCETAAQYAGPPAVTSPTLQALSLFENEWGEDWYSAYGFTLIIAAGRNAMQSSKDTRGPDPP